MLQYPVAINACCMENANGDVPADIAIKAGHNDMGIMLDEFCKRKVGIYELLRFT